MPGGLLQLSKYGSQDQYLTGNPQMTFYKAVYRRFTNFSMESIRLTCDGPDELSESTDVKLSCRVNRNGDLITQVYFVCNIPDIYSGYETNIDSDGTQIDDPQSYDFQWCKALGAVMIRKVSLTIGGSTIDELYGEWIEIWHELFDKNNKNNFDKMIGNTPDVFIPSFSIGQGSVYPTSTLDPALNTDPNIFSDSAFLTNPYLKVPSIVGRQLYIPIPFYFCNNPGLALPLIALQYHEVAFTVELRPLNEIYTIIEAKAEEDNFKSRVKPELLKDHHKINNFITKITNNKFTKGENLTNTSAKFQGWGLDPHFDVNYVFLDKEERNRFASVTHEYLIEQTQTVSFLGVVGNKTLNLPLHHPVKMLVWTAARTDFENLNIYNNYTNWKFEEVPDYSNQALSDIFGEADIDTATGTLIDRMMIAYNNDEIPNKFNFFRWKQDIITSSRLLFNGIERFSSRNGPYFSRTQHYQHNIVCDKPGVHVYSFSLEPSKYQPSGYCNMSNIPTIQMEIETLPIKSTESDNDTLQYEYKYNINFYSINYNILKIMNGMGGLVFA